MSALHRFGNVSRKAAIAPGKFEQAQQAADGKAFEKNEVKHAIIKPGLGRKKKFAAIASHIGNQRIVPFIYLIVAGYLQLWRPVSDEAEQAGQMIGRPAQQSLAPAAD